LEQGIALFSIPPEISAAVDAFFPCGSTVLNFYSSFFAQLIHFSSYLFSEGHGCPLPKVFSGFPLFLGFDTQRMKSTFSPRIVTEASYGFFRFFVRDEKVTPYWLSPAVRFFICYFK